MVDGRSPPVSRVLTLYRALFAGILAAALAGTPAIAGPHRDGPRHDEQQQRGWPQRDADRAFQDTRDGRAMPLPQIERRVMPYMPGADYLGPELNGDSYRLKFMQNGRVIWVDVDSQTGRILRRSH
jgi:uncharacterized membrane protein YkoI